MNRRAAGETKLSETLSFSASGETSIREVIPFPKQEYQLPVILSPEEVLRLLEAAPSFTHHMIFSTMYGTGLRVSEALHLQVPDLDTIPAIDEALTRLTAEDSGAGEIARLRLFAGFSLDEAAIALGVSRATAHREWTYARAWLVAALNAE